MAELNELKNIPLRPLAELKVEFSNWQNRIHELGLTPDYKINPEYIKLLPIGIKLLVDIERASRK
jgi:hypothetical protein